MDKIEALQVFNTVAQQHSFTKAADLLQYPRSSVSALIQQLEHHLGVRLFFRTTRTVRLTHEGEKLLERSTALLQQLEELEQLFQPSTTLTGQLRVAAPSRLVTQLIAPHLPSLLQEHPKLYIELKAADQISDLIKEGIDCVIRFGALADSSLIAQPLGQCAMMNCASPAYLERYGTPKTLTDLAQHYMVGYTSQTPQLEQWEYLHGSEAGQFTLRTQIAVTDTESYIACALAGLGLIQVPAYDAQQYLSSGQLVSILPQFAAPPMPVYALYPHRKYLSERTQVFIQFMRQILQQALIPNQ
ncbi:LysR family transcriptional regulator [Thiofilum flexile]|uniref:LysR family transcriptional regulator n=1 Tax=Thiofilum flexile TaxID=125627 RepID=UPI000380CFC2|nr:LysR family transcriptional regulator [Thiofilum flexile]